MKKIRQIREDASRYTPSLIQPQQKVVDDLDMPPVFDLHDDETFARIDTYIRQINGFVYTDPKRVLGNLQYKLHLVGINFQLPTEGFYPTDEAYWELGLTKLGGVYGPNPDGTFDDNDGYDESFSLYIEIDRTDDGKGWTIDARLGLSDEDIDDELEDEDFDIDDGKEPSGSEDDIRYMTVDQAKSGIVNMDENVLEEGIMSDLFNKIKRVFSKKAKPTKEPMYFGKGKNDLHQIAQGMWYYMEELIANSHTGDDVDIDVKRLIHHIEIEINWKIKKEDYMGFAEIFYYGGVKPRWGDGDSQKFRKYMVEYLQEKKSATMNEEVSCEEGCDCNDLNGEDPMDKLKAEEECGDDCECHDDKEVIKEDLNGNEHEIKLWIDNTQSIYKEQMKMLAVLVRKKEIGKYNRKDAVKMMLKIVELGIREYNKNDFEDIRLSSREKLAVAGELVDDFVGEANLGNFDDHLRNKKVSLKGMFD